MKPFTRYLGFQLPSWLFGVALAVGLVEWSSVPAWMCFGAVGVFVLKDLVIYPFVRKAYESGHHDAASLVAGARGVVIVPLEPQGWVLVGAERWRAVLTGDVDRLAEGEHIRVVDIRRHTLIVVPD